MNIYNIIKEFLFEKQETRKWEHFGIEEAKKFAEKLDRDFREGKEIF